MSHRDSAELLTLLLSSHTQLLDSYLKSSNFTLCRYDKNGDGVLSLEEFEDVLRSHGTSVTRAEAERFFADVDADSNKRIDYTVRIRVRCPWPQLPQNGTHFQAHILLFTVVTVIAVNIVTVCALLCERRSSFAGTRARASPACKRQGHKAEAI